VTNKKICDRPCRSNGEMIANNLSDVILNRKSMACIIARNVASSTRICCTPRHAAGSGPDSFSCILDKSETHKFYSLMKT
jgi:hypothetical protein